MFFLHRTSQQGFSGRPWGSSLMTSGALCILFGIAIIAAPELLAYIVATFLIFIGVWMLMAWYRLRKTRKFWP